MNKIGIIVFLIVLAGLVPSVASAFSLAPATFDLSSDRGDVLQEEIKVFNQNSVDQTVYLDVVPFDAGDGNGAPRFLDHRSDSDLANWILLDHAQVVLPANSFVEVPFSVIIPDDVPSTGYYAAITVSETPSELVASNGVSIQATIASLIFLTVEGDGAPKLAFLDVQSDAEGHLRSLFAGDIHVRLQNQGNVHALPIGSITISDIFGRSLHSQPFNTEHGRVLPGTTREFVEAIKEESSESFFGQVRQQFAYFAAGPMTVSIAIDDLSITTGQMSYSFWYLPWQACLFTLFVLLILCLVFYGFVKVHRASKQ